LNQIYKVEVGALQTTVLQLPEREKHQGGGITSGVAYDTAWTARVIDHCGNPVFPECVRWLVENQRQDGSWGSQILNYHDRILSTVSAIMALKEIDESRHHKAIQHGEAYIWDNIKNLTQDAYRLIGSELLFPSLMEQAESMGLNVPAHVKVYQREYRTKLNKVDESLWYSPLTTLSFSFEFLGETVDTTCLENVLLSNGSVANSPAATAFFLKHRHNANAVRYLKEILSITRDGSVMTVYPIDVFEYGWTMYNLMLAGLYFNQFSEICDFLYSHLTPSGVGWSAEYPVPDTDDTAVVCKVLYDMGYPLDFHLFDTYDTGDYYLGYSFESDPAVSANIHILDFVSTCSEFPDRDAVIDRLVRFLQKEIYSSGYWIDKWHVSPYYPTSHAVTALCDTAPSLAGKAVSWILDTQHENGLWGQGNGTLEETAYAVQALIYYHRNVEPIDTEPVITALRALNFREMAGICFTDLWIGKVLYTPVRVVWSATKGAQFMVRTNIM
jgi:hypothetical protein